MNIAAIRDVPCRLKLTVDDYFLLSDAGVLAERGRTELVDGEIFLMNSQFRRHALVKIRLYDRIAPALRGGRTGLTAMVEATVALPPHDAPDPDITLTREPTGEGAIPAHSVALVVEVSDSTLSDDLGRKARLYARHGIPEYWVVDCPGARITQFWEQAPEGYRQCRELSFGERLREVSVAGLDIDTDLLA